MKKLSCLMLAAWLVFSLTCAAAALEPEEEILAEAAVLLDADTGQVLYDKNMNARKFPASTTKIMTGLLTVENCETTEIVEASDEAVADLYGTSHIALTPGERLPVDSAMYALMLPSANDAANALAEHVGGSQEAFARMMTEKAKQLGATHTNFINASGLPDPQHYTTAHDLALITGAAIKNKEFLRYFGTDRRTIPATNMQEEERPLTNQQFMLLPDMWVYNPDVIGGKVGYTEEARHTMSTAASKNGVTLIAVVLGCGVDQKFYDTQALFDFGYEAFTKVQMTIPEPETTTVPIMDGEDSAGEGTVIFPEEQVSLLLPHGTTVNDVELSYKIPDRFEKGKDAAASVILSLKEKPGDHTPLLLREIPLDIEMHYDDAAPAPLLAWADRDNMAASDKEDDGVPRDWRFYAIPAGVAAVLLLVYLRARRLRKRAEKRRRRLQEKIMLTKRNEGAA